MADNEEDTRPHPPIPVLNWEERSDWKNVKKAGAAGDGKADDTSAIQGVLDTIGEKHDLYPGDRDTIYFPAGTYRITAPLRVSHKTRLHGTTFIGHGRDTRIVWDGPPGQTMLVADSIAYARYEGFVLDGQGRAGVGIIHPNKAFVTEPRYRHLALLNFSDSGIKVDPARAQAQAEANYENCYFEACGRGVTFLRWNDYNHVFDGCEFRDCGIGIECDNGSFFVLNTHFAGSRIVDIKAHPHHGSSIRRVTSEGSQSFLLFMNATAPITLQDVHVSRSLRYSSGDMRLAGGPVTIIDSVFSTPPGGTAPIRIDRDGQILIVSNNKVEGAQILVAPSRKVKLYEIPPGKLGGSVTSATQRFIKDSVPIPGKVFDAVRDFGAKANGKTDDTTAVQATIDAAREHGKNAIAYLPAGKYIIRQPLKISGSNYTFGGTGFGTALAWTGPADGSVLHVEDPAGITVEQMRVASSPGENTASDILQTSSGKGSSVLYDGLKVFGRYQKQPFRKGILLQGLGAGDQVVLNSIQGNLRIVNCGDATILGNFTYEGSISVEGTETGRSGFLGFITRLATVVTHALYIKDNHSFVAGDFYHEQSDGILHISGSADLPPGRVVFTGGRSHLGKSDKPSCTIDGYRGEVFIGGKDFSDYRTPDDPPNLMVQTGKSAVDMYLFGSLFYGSRLEVEQETMRVFMLGNESLEEPAFVKYDPEDTAADEALEGMARAFDDLRRLGKMDLKINHPESR